MMHSWPVYLQGLRHMLLGQWVFTCNSILFFLQTVNRSVIGMQVAGSISVQLHYRNTDQICKMSFHHLWKHSIVGDQSLKWVISVTSEKTTDKRLLSVSLMVPERFNARPWDLLSGTSVLYY